MINQMLIYDTRVQKSTCRRNINIKKKVIYGVNANTYWGLGKMYSFRKQPLKNTCWSGTKYILKVNKNVLKCIIVNIFQNLSFVYFEIYINHFNALSIAYTLFLSLKMFSEILISSSLLFIHNFSRKRPSLQ